MSSEVLSGPGSRAADRVPVAARRRRSRPLSLACTIATSRLVWGANMAIRRRAFERAGMFVETILGGRGDEEEWERRYAAGGGRIRYVAGAGLHHRRTAADSTISSLARAAYSHGRSARRFDTLRGEAPSLARELLTLAGCAWHVVRRRCAIGIVLFAQTAGRLHEALAARLVAMKGTSASHSQAGGRDRLGQRDTALGPDDFLSGTSGEVSGIRATTSAIVADLLEDARRCARLEQLRLRRVAASSARRRVLALAIERTDAPNLLPAARA